MAHLLVYLEYSPHLLIYLQCTSQYMYKGLQTLSRQADMKIFYCWVVYEGLSEWIANQTRRHPDRQQTSTEVSSTCYSSNPDSLHVMSPRLKLHICMITIFFHLKTKQKNVRGKIISTVILVNRQTIVVVWLWLIRALYHPSVCVKVWAWFMRGLCHPSVLI